MRFEQARVTGDPGGEMPWMRVDANRPYVFPVTASMLAVLILAFATWVDLPTPLAWVAAFVLALGGMRFIILVGPARLLTSPWVTADEHGISGRNRRGVVQYGWDRVISVGWILHGAYLTHWTAVEVKPTLGAPESPYGPINPDEIANLWFLSSKRRSRAIGRDLLSVCRHNGSRTQLLVGAEREG